MEQYLELIGYSNELCQDVYRVCKDTPKAVRSKIGALYSFVSTEIEGEEVRGYVKQ